MVNSFYHSWVVQALCLHLGFPEQEVFSLLSPLKNYWYFEIKKTKLYITTAPVLAHSEAVF